MFYLVILASTITVCFFLFRTLYKSHLWSFLKVLFPYLPSLLSFPFPLPSSTSFISLIHLLFPFPLIFLFRHILHLLSLPLSCHLSTFHIQTNRDSLLYMYRCIYIYIYICISLIFSYLYASKNILNFIHVTDFLNTCRALTRLPCVSH